MRVIKISQQDFALKRWGGGRLMRKGVRICGTLQYMYVHPTWWLCGVHTHTYIPFKYDPQVEHTHNAYPAPGRIDMHFYFCRTLIHSPHTLHVGGMNTCTYHAPSRQDTHILPSMCIPSL